MEVAVDKHQRANRGHVLALRLVDLVCHMLREALEEPRVA